MSEVFVSITSCNRVPGRVHYPFTYDMQALEQINSTSMFWRTYAMNILSIACCERLSGMIRDRFLFFRDMRNILHRKAFLFRLSVVASSTAWMVDHMGKCFTHNVVVIMLFLLWFVVVSPSSLIWYVKCICAKTIVLIATFWNKAWL